MGCNTTDDSGSGGTDHVGRAPSESVAEAHQALSPTPTCISIARTGSTGTVFDAQIANKAPPKNYGASETMNTGVFGVGNEQRQSLVQFDLSAIPSTPNGTTNIVSATVALTRGGLTPTGIDLVTVHRVTSSWNETTVTWQSFGAAFDPQVEASFSNAATTFAFDLTPLTVSWFQGTLPNYGILLDQTSFASNFWSSDRTDETVRPRLDVCFTQSCSAGFADCNNDPSDGCEVNTNTTVTDCGACATACSAPANGTAACIAGVCGVASCNAGFADCNADGTDGCETNLATNTNHCGSCNSACSSTNATPSCAAGQCGIASCNAGFADCNSNAADGCEVNTNTSAGNCGSCGHACSTANGTASCASGSCTVGGCNAGFANCDGNAANGCETNTNTSTNNCGACNNVCSIANGSAACTSGSCAVAACNAGFANCNGVAADGCETNLLTNVLSCGACGNACSLPNAIAACSAGGCVIASCNAGFADCDGNPANGCEINLNTDPTHCGACTTACSVSNGTAACSAGTCQVGACNAGFANCDGSPANGCEVNTTNNPSNCGACGNTCSVANGTAACSASTCQVAACNAGFGNCNGIAADGCETNLTNSGSNCGTCGNNCATQCSSHVSATSCTAGACGITACQPGFFNIDGTCSDGCECQSSNTSQSCASPTNIGVLQIGQSAIYTGNLVPSGTVAYLQVAFNGNTNLSYHPRVRFTSNPNSEYQFDILTNCSGSTVACGVEGGVAVGKTDWETLYTAGDPNDPGTFNAIPAVGAGGTVIVRVYRKAGAPVDCNSYTLTFSN